MDNRKLMSHYRQQSAHGNEQITGIANQFNGNYCEIKFLPGLRIIEHRISNLLSVDLLKNKW